MALTAAEGAEHGEMGIVGTMPRLLTCVVVATALASSTGCGATGDGHVVEDKAADSTAVPMTRTVEEMLSSPPTSSVPSGLQQATGSPGVGGAVTSAPATVPDPGNCGPSQASGPVAPSLSGPASGLPGGQTYQPGVDEGAAPPSGCRPR